jgi:hypothetical protein
MPRRSKPGELQVVVLSGSGEQTHSLRLTRRKVALAIACWLLILVGAALWGFQSAGPAAKDGSSPRAGSSAGARSGEASRQ